MTKHRDSTAVARALAYFDGLRGRPVDITILAAVVGRGGERTTDLIDTLFEWGLIGVLPWPRLTARGRQLLNHYREEGYDVE